MHGVSMSKTILFFVSPLYVKQSEKEINFDAYTIRLRDFQYELLKVYLNKESKDVVLLNAPTGAGKTFTLLLPLIANLEGLGWWYQGSIGLYPSRELAGDQMTSIFNMLIKLGAILIDLREVYNELRDLSDDEVGKLSEYIKVFELRVGNTSIPVVLLYITSDSLKALREIFSKHIQSVKSNKDVLAILWSGIARNSYRVIFTVPEYPYLVGVGIYQDFHRAGVWLYSVLRELKRFLKAVESNNIEVLKKWFRELENKIGRGRLFEEYYVSRDFLNELGEIYQFFNAPVFFDEFHLYSGFTLASFISLFYILLYGKGVGKIVISSATPTKHVLVKKKRKDVVKLIKSLAEEMNYNFVEISSQTLSMPETGFEQIRKRTVVKIVPVLLIGKNVAGAPAFGALQRRVPELLERSGWLEDYRRLGRSMIIVDRVASVLESAEHVEKITGEKPLTICSVRELLLEVYAPRETARLREAKLVVGNMAIAFGVDIEGMDLGVIVAKDHLTALQKIGRIGRGKGENIAIIYLPIPLYKYKMLEGSLKQLEGKEIPYISKELNQQKETTNLDFITLLKKLYPRISPDILLRSKIGIAKIVLPVWVYTLATMIRQRDTIREELHTAKNLKEVRYLYYFVVLVNEIEDFFEIKNLRRKLRMILSSELTLTPVGLFNLFTYRNIAGIPIKRKIESEEVEEVLELTTAGRNIPLMVYNGEFYVDENTKRIYEYTQLWIGVYHPEAVIGIIKELNEKVIVFPLLIELTGNGDLRLFQGSKELCTLWQLLRNTYLTDAPILVVYSGTTKRSYKIEYLSALDSMIPIYVVKFGSGGRIERGELVGGIYLL